jgi:hypothetical protein
MKIVSTMQKLSRPALAAFLLLAVATPALAHIGPPYPIMQNRHIGPYGIEVWSNPDVGTGSFFIIITPPPGTALPSDLKVSVAVQPLTHRLPEAAYGAWREKLIDRIEYKTDVPFDKEEMWHIRILLASSSVNGETDTDVMVTPTLAGRWDLLLFLLPFLGVGFLWFKALRVKSRQRRRRKAQATASSSAPKQEEPVR